MALAHEPDVSGLVNEHVPLSVPRWTDSILDVPQWTARPAERAAQPDESGEPLVSPEDRSASSDRQLRLLGSEASESPSIYDMPIEPLPAPRVSDALVLRPGIWTPPVHATAPGTSRPDAVVLPFVRDSAEVHDYSPIDYRPAFVGAAFLAASLCASLVVAPAWFSTPPSEATSTVQAIASQVTALVGVTGVSALAAVVSTALLLVGAQPKRVSG